MHVWFLLPTSIENVGKSKENVRNWLNKYWLLNSYYWGRKYRKKMQVYFQPFSFKITLQKSNSHKKTLHSMSLKAFRYKDTCKNWKSHCTKALLYSVFKLSVKNKTGKSQRVRDKTYKVVNLINSRASIISMDISMDLSMYIHIHGTPENMTKLTIWIP